MKFKAIKLVAINRFPEGMKLKLSMASRIVLAIVGGYAVAVAADLACLALPIDRISAVYWGQIVSVLACAGVIILVFSTQTAWRAWLCVCAIAAIFLGIWYFLAP